jgi:hypothetical protein
VTNGGGKGIDAPVGYRNPPKSHQFVKGRSGNSGGRPRRLKAIIPGVPAGDFEDMMLEEMGRAVSVREGESIERMPLIRAATRAIGLKAAKGDVKAFLAVTRKLATIETRQQALWEQRLATVVAYKELTTQELDSRRKQGVVGPEIIPHPDDICIDSKKREIVFNGPMTPDQKMAQDFLVSFWPTAQRDWLDAPRFHGKNPHALRIYARMKKRIEIVTRLIEKRASKTNSWTSATLEERRDYFWKFLWKGLSRSLPLEVVQSERMARTAFNGMFGIEETEEERREFPTEYQRFYLMSQGIVLSKKPRP